MGDYDLTLGPLLIGIIFNTFLFGLVTSQYITYYMAGFKDPKLVQWMVTFLFALDIVHSGSLVWMAWGYCVVGYGKPETLLIALWPYTFSPIANGNTSLVIQLFLGWRIYTLCKNIWLYFFIICLAVTSCVLGCTAGIKAWVIEYILDMPQLAALSTSWLVMQVGTEVFVTATLGILLFRSRTGMKRMNTVLNCLIRGAIQTGLFAGIFSILNLICFLSWPTTNFCGIFAISIGRIYTNTLLDTLNSRMKLRDHLNSATDIESDALTGLCWKTATQPTKLSADVAQTASLSGIEVQKDVSVYLGDESEQASISPSDEYTRKKEILR